jgi:hypothetical protein
MAFDVGDGRKEVEESSSCRQLEAGCQARRWRGGGATLTYRQYPHVASALSLGYFAYSRSEPILVPRSDTKRSTVRDAGALFVVEVNDDACL